MIKIFLFSSASPLSSGYGEGERYQSYNNFLFFRTADVSVASLAAVADER